MIHFKPFQNSLGLLLFFTTFFVLTACEKQEPIEPIKKEILIYCGTTMAQPMREIADLIQEQIDHGGLLLWVRTRDEDHEKRAVDILKKHSGKDVHLHDIPV